MSQVEQIKRLLNDGEYHCARELEAISWSKHKRIRDTEIKYDIEIESRVCDHSIVGAKDYRIKDWKPPRVYRPMTDEEVTEAYRKLSTT